ncbi:LOW QUALITY PROTEIN: hypothetical protein HID58_056818, partial [Brassica napus]
SICVQSLLSSKTFRSFENIRKEEINVMMDKLEKASSSSSRVNLSKLLMTLTYDVIARIVLGKKYSSDEHEDYSNNLDIAFGVDTKCLQLLEPVEDVLQEVINRASDRGITPLHVAALKGDIETVRLLLDWELLLLMDTIVCLSVFEALRTPTQEIGSNSVSLSESSGKDTRRKANFLEQEEALTLTWKKNKICSVQTIWQVVVLRVSLHCHCRGKVKRHLSRMQCQSLLIIFPFTKDFPSHPFTIFENDMLFGGSASTFTLLEWTMTELMRHPKCMKKLQDEIRSVQPHYSYVSEKEAEKMNYLNVMIKEALRLHPPVQINVWAIQREIATWGPDADEFRPERHLDSLLDFHGNDQKYIPFGSGRRKCPGIGLAIALAEVTLANLVNRFDWRIEVGPLGDDKHYLDEASSIDVCRKFPLFAFHLFLNSTCKTL